MRRAHRDQDRVLERRKIAALTELEFLLEVTCEVMMARKLDRRAKWRVSLHKHLAMRFAAPRASGYLRKKLKGSFAGAEIRQMQGEIGIDDSDERDVRKMQSLVDDLGADQDVDLTRPKISQSFPIRFLARHGVCVHAAHHGFWKNLRHG